VLFDYIFLPLISFLRCCTLRRTS